MENVLRDLYRKQSSVLEPTDFSIDLLQRKLSREISKRKKWATQPRKKKKFVFQTSPTKEELDERIQSFGLKVSQVPGLEDLEKKKNAVEIICWSLILLILIVLTGYSFVHLVMDYRNNPTRTNVKMHYSDSKSLSNATLCLPFYIDKIPLAENSTFNSLYTWEETAKTLRTLLAREKNLDYIFSCPDWRRVDHEASPREVEARLINEKGRRNQDYGRVEIALEGVWGTVCNTAWDNNDARVVCKMITGRDSPNARTLHAIQGSAYPELVWMDGVDCAGDEANIGHCSHLGWGKSDCTALDLAAVDCLGNANPGPWKETRDTMDSTEKNFTKTELPELELQLRDEKGIVNKERGIVELGFRGTWGTISDQHWGNKEAMVVCRMLGWTEEQGQGFNGSIFGWGHGTTWAAKVSCNGNETSIRDCFYELTSRNQADLAGVDCNGSAEKSIRVSEIMRNYTISRTAAALFARLTAFETWRLIPGETESSLKWSTSPAYPAGNFYKEQAIESLLTIMSRSGRKNNLKRLRQLFSCGLCHALELDVSFQLDRFTTRRLKLFDCKEIVMTWMEDFLGSHRACFHIPLGRNPITIPKATISISLNMGNIYDHIPWSSERARELYSENFKLDLSGSLNAEKETVSIVELSPGEAQTVTLDATAKYNMHETQNCEPNKENCELKCIAKVHEKPCSHLCTPFTWEILLNQGEGGKPYCMLEDYRRCYRQVKDPIDVHLQCLEECKQPCQHTTYAVRTLVRKPLAKKSATKLSIKLNSDVYPSFVEKKAVTWYGLMGDLGGVLGLWLGASFCGVLHFAWFIIFDVIWRKKKVEAMVSRQISARPNNVVPAQA